MAIPKDFKYPLDITGKELTNFIGGELHTVTKESSRLLVIRSGAFFTDHTKVYDWVTKVPLTLGEDYRFLCLYKEATLAASAEIATVIELIDPTRTGKFGIDTQVIGGEFSYNDAVIIGLLLDLIEDNREIDWDTIKNLPTLWDPSYHMHLADTDIYGTGGITKGLERIADAVTLRNVAAITDPIMEEVATKVSKHAPVKVGIEDSVFRPSSRTSRLIRVTLPKSTLGHSRVMATIQIKEPNGFTNFTFCFNENGSEFADVVISRHGNSDSFWAAKLTTFNVRGNSFDFCTDWIREDNDPSEITFVVLSYVVETDNPSEMTGNPLFAEYDSLPAGWSDDDIIYPDIDKRDFVTRNRNRMLEPTRPFVNFQTLGASDTFNVGESNLFAIKFPLVVDGRPLNFTIKTEVDILSGGTDKGTFMYTLTGTYYQNGKFTLANVEVDGQPGNPLTVGTANSFHATNPNFFIFKSTEADVTLKGRATLVSMEVDSYERETWIEDWGLVLTKDEVGTGINASTLVYTYHKSVCRDLNERASFQKLYFNNALYCPDSTAEGVGIKLKIPTLKTRLEARNVPFFAYGTPTTESNAYAVSVYNGFDGLMPINDIITIELVITSKLSDKTRFTDIYTITYSATLQDLSVVRVGNGTNEVSFSVDGSGALHMHGQPNWPDCVIWVRSILLLMVQPETYPKTLMWATRTSGEQSGNSGMIKSIDTTTPRLEKFLTDTAKRLTDDMTKLEEDLTQTINILTKDVETLGDDVTALKTMVLQPGMAVAWTSDTIPSGYIAYHGQSFNKAAFPKLALLYPSGIMPNWQDDFLRTASATRAVGSKQAQSVQPLGFVGDPHNHGYTYAYNNGFTTGGGGGGRPRHATNTQVTTASSTTGKITGTGTETRPRNVAVHWITLMG